MTRPLRDSAADRRLAYLSERLAAEPLCPVTRYLLACEQLSRRHTAEAVRNFMLVYHAEADLQSAALLVFAGLNWIARPAERLAQVVLSTWYEYRRPAFDQTRRERRLLDAVAVPLPEWSGAPPIARALWRLPIELLRAELRAANGRADAA